MPAAFSNDMEYWKPEQPPPTTPMRSPAGMGSCVAMISRTLAMAAGVRTTGVEGDAGALTTSAGVLVTDAVAMIAISCNTFLISVLPCSSLNKILDVPGVVQGANRVDFVVF